MDLEGLEQLLTPIGEQALQAAGAFNLREADFLSAYQKLSRVYPPALARAAVETAILRPAAAGKFPHAARMYFTREALEQASGSAVAQYRSRRYAGFDRLLDLCCSIGGDTAALASMAPTIGIDRDELRLRIAQANLARVGQAERVLFVQAELAAALPPVRRIWTGHGQTGIFFDPARRSSGRRLFSIHAYQPPLDIVFDHLEPHPALGVKISPGVDLAELQGFPAELEFISVNGELKEGVLWFGPLRSAARRATLLPEVHTLSAGAADRPTLDAAPRLSEPQDFIYEPDPAVLRAGLVRLLADQLSLFQLDADIAYLTGGAPVDTPFARRWQVEDWFPFGLKRLRQELQRRGVNRVTVKKRGSPIDPQELIRALKLKSAVEAQPEERLVFLTHLRGRPIVVLAYPPKV